MRPISELPPVVGNWYRRLDRPQPFQVVAFDAAAGTVEIEYFDGTVDEWPAAHWYALDIAPSEQPQDWSGPFDTGNDDGLALDEDRPAADAGLDLDSVVEREALRLSDGEA